MKHQLPHLNLVQVHLQLNHHGHHNHQENLPPTPSQPFITRIPTLCCILTLLYQIDSIENCRDYYKFCVISLSHHGERHGDEFSSMSNKCGGSLSFRVDCQKYLLSLCIFSGSSHLSNCHSRLNLFNSYVFPKPTHPTLLLNYILM